MKDTKGQKVVVIIPAFNEENAVGQVLGDIPNHLVDEVIVVNNNSTDRTSEEALKGGATVIDEPVQGYGNACLKGMEYIKENRPDDTDIVVFLDADYSDYPEEMSLLLAPILEEDYDFVVGSRALGNRERGSMNFPQRVGNWIAGNMLYLLYGQRSTDLGPFRAIKYDSLLRLGMKDRTYGWTVEMQIKAAKQKMKFREVAVNYRKRIGFSKISGTLKGALSAGYKILSTIFRYL